MADGPSDGQAHARASLATRTPVEERVHHIKGLMARGEWFTRATALQLSEEWGVSLSAVKTYAAEASRALRQITDEAELAELKAATITRLERLSAKAEKVGELRTAVRAEETKAKVAGVVTSESRTLVVVVPIAGVEVKATVEELRALVGRISTFLSERHPTVAAELGAYLTEGAT